VEDIRLGQNDKVREAVTKLNKVFVADGKIIKTVIGIDATVSMSAALDQVLNNTKVCLERTYKILSDKGITSGFEIQMAVYRNYNSAASKLFQFSPFSRNSNDLVNFLKEIKAEGGWRNEAIENLYNHALKFETDVDQVIVIADAAGNTQSEIVSKRKNKGETYWKDYPRFTDVLNGE
jgi:hypothetical protein